MYTSKLIQILKTFSKEEVKDLGNYLSISKGVIGEKCLVLSKLILKHHPEYTSPRLKKEKIFQKAYPTEIYKPGKLEKLMSHLLSLLQDFIVYRNSGIENELHQLRILFDFYNKKELHVQAEANLKKYDKILQQGLNVDTVSFYDSFLIEKSIANHQILSHTSKKTLKFFKVHKSLDNYYIFEKLTLACRTLAIHRYLFPVDADENLMVLDKLIPLLDAGFFEEPIIKVYYRAYLFLKSEEKNLEEKFLAFENELARYHESMPEEQLVVLVTIIRNYCVKQYHNGIDGYLEKTFYIYKDHLEKGYLYHKGGLFASTLMNIVVFGLRLKEYDWILNLIQSHKEKIIGTSSPQEAYKLNMANYYFHIANYEQALDLLENNYEDVYYKLRAKRMEIKIYVEMNHVLLGARIDAFKIFVYRISPEKISTKRKEGNREFIDTLKQINLPRTFKNEKRIEKLINKITTSKFINEKEWLLEKLETLR